MESDRDHGDVRAGGRRWRGATIGSVVTAGAGSTLGYVLLGAIAAHEGTLGHDDLVGIVLWSIGPLVGVAAVLYVWRRRPNHRLLPWFATMGGLTGVGLLLRSLPDVSVAARSDALLAVSTLTAATLTDVLAAVAFIRVAVTFPDGRYLRTIERRAVRWSWLLLLPVAVNALLVPQVPFPSWTDYGPVDNPWFVGFGVDNAVGEALLGLAFASILPALVLFATRYRLLDQARRRRARWIVLPFVLSVLAIVGEALLVASSVLTEQQFGITFALLPIALYAGIALGLSGTGADVDRVLRRSLVYGVLWLAVAAAYVALSAAVGVVAGSRLPVEWAILLTIGASMVFQPARRWLERAVDRWVFGRRADPTRMIARLGEALEGGLDLESALPRMSSTLTEGLGLEWADVRLVTGSPPGRAPDRVPELQVPIVHRDEVVGSVECGPKVVGALTEEDRAVVETLARQAGLTVGNVRLTRELLARVEQLAESRSRLVRAQQAERRRIERDIHDGVQQGIVGLMAHVGALRQRDGTGLVPRDELAVVHDGLTRLLAELRELAAGIHPSVLTDLGLLASVEALASRSTVPTSVRADDRVRCDDVPEEVAEVAYFTVAEALANCAKHARAGEAEITLRRVDGVLRISVRDDGIGVDPATVEHGRGAGMTNLAERAAALDGTLAVTGEPGRGTVVDVTIPLPVASRRDRS